MGDEVSARKRWSEEETVLALFLYFQLPFGRLHSGNPEIQQLAAALGRSNSSVAMKLVNFASLDPKIIASGRKGLDGASKLDRALYAQFGQDWSGLVLRAETMWETQVRPADEGAAPPRLKENKSEFLFEPFQGESVTQALVAQRIGQGFFRRAVLANYDGICCVTGIADPRLLIASHIKPWGVDVKNRHNPANGILLSGEDVELGVLPSGTGGDFRRTLGMPHSNREAAVALRDGQTKSMDVGKVTFCDHAGKPASRYFLNVSSVGLAAEIIKRVKSAKVFDWLPVESVRGKANFAVSTLQEILDLDPALIRVRFDDGNESTLQTIAFCVANSRYFGGGMMIAPEARINDGLLDVVNIGDIGTAKIILNALTLYRGTHNRLDEVNSTLAQRIEIAAADPSREILIETDGELPGKLPATYEIVPNALRVRVPLTNYS